MVKNPPVSAGNVVSIPGSGRSRGEGNGNPLQYSCLGNPMDSVALWATLSMGSQKQQQDSVPFNAAFWGFPDSSVGKESACNAGDPGLISGSGRSAGEGIGSPF